MNIQPQYVKPYYPEIGEALPKSQPKWLSTAKKIAVAVAVVFVSAAVGFCAGGPYGMAIGAAVGVAVSLLLGVAKIIHDYVSKNRLLYQLPQEGGHTALLPADTAKLGKYCRANLRLTEDADESRDWKLKMIDAANESIELSCNFAWGELLRDVLSRIDNKMQEIPHFKAHIIISHSPYLELQDIEMVEKLKKRYAGRFECLITDCQRKFGLSIHSEENHMKTLVVDGTYFVAGGTGLSYNFCRDKYAPVAGESTGGLIPPASKDTDLVGESRQMAELMRDQFFNLYRLWEIRTHGNSTVSSRYFPLTKPKGVCSDFYKQEGLFPNVRLKYIVGGPEHESQNPIVREYEKRILRSERRIRLANWKFHPSERIRQAFVQAKEMRPDIKVVAHLNGMSEAYSLGRYYLTHMSRASYHLVDKVYEYTEPHQLYHKKVTTFDDSHLIIGSFNYTKKSAKYDHEGVFVVKSGDLVRSCREDLMVDKARSVKVYPSDPACTNIFARIYSCLLAGITQNEL